MVNELKEVEGSTHGLIWGHLPGRTKERQKIISQDSWYCSWDANLTPPKHKWSTTASANLFNELCSVHSIRCHRKSTFSLFVISYHIWPTQRCIQWVRGDISLRVKWLQQGSWPWTCQALPTCPLFLQSTVLRKMGNFILTDNISHHTKLQLMAEASSMLYTINI